MNVKLKETTRLALAAVFMGLSMLLTRGLSFYIPLNGVPSVRVGFGTLPIVLASLICGPALGALAGGGADLIGAFAFPVGPYYYGYTIDAALQGVLPWLLLFIFKKRKKSLLAYDATVWGLVIATVWLYIFSANDYSNGNVDKFAFTPWVRTLISLILLGAAFFSIGAVGFLRHYENHFQARRTNRKANLVAYSFTDVYSIFLTTDYLIIVLLASYWTHLYYGLPYGYNIFNATISMFITLPIKTFVLSLAMDPLTQVGAFSLRQKTRRYGQASGNGKKLSDLLFGGKRQNRLGKPQE